MPSAKTIGTPFIELHSVDSTNNYAMAMVHAGMAQHGTVVFTYEQTKGKGQRGKNWESNKNENIAMSIVLHAHSLPPSPFMLSMAVAIGTLNMVTGLTNGDVTIKWPNDIYWRDRKAGGILIENVFKGTDWKHAIAGIGLNCNQVSFGGLQQKAVSLKQITGKTFDVVTLANELINHIDAILQQMHTAPHTITQLYHQHLYKIGQTVKLRKDNRVFQTTIKGVNAIGQLVTQNALEEVFDVGAVEWVL